MDVTFGKYNTNTYNRATSMCTKLCELVLFEYQPKRQEREAGTYPAL